MMLLPLQAALLFSIATAQTSNSLINITFSPAGSSSCGRGADNAFTFSLDTSPPPYTAQCYTLNGTSANRNQTSPTFSGNLEPGANYSQIEYLHPNDQSDRGSNLVANREVRMYNDYGCGTHFSDEYYAWNCFDATGHCANLEFTVGSFAIWPLSEDERNGRCVLAAQERSDAPGRMNLSWALGVGALAVWFAMGMS